MEKHDDNTPLSAPEPGGRKRGLLIALVALVVIVAGAAFTYSALTQSGARPSEAREAAALSSSAAGQASSTSASSASSSSSRVAYYLSDYDSTVYTEQGAPLHLSEIAKGKPLVLNFWATWCPYCIQEMGDFQKIFDDYGDRVSFAFIDSVDGQRETVEKGAAWMRDNGYTLPTYFDTDFSAAQDYRATSLPTTVVIGADGEILAISAGAIDPNRMRNALDAMLSM